MSSRPIVIVAAAAIWCGALAGVGGAQTAAPASARQAASIAPAPGATEWGVGGATGIGVGRRRDEDNSSYVIQALSWGRVLTGLAGPPPLRGRFEWAVEVVPFFGQYRPDGAVGVGVSPLVWRWNLERHGAVGPFVEVAGGGLWTNVPVPNGTSAANFTAHAGAGIRLFTSRRRGFVVAYRFQHISNGNSADRNPGINAHAVYVGWTMFRE